MEDDTKKETKPANDITQDAKQRRRYVQSGKGPGEFGPDYSHRKRYQLGEVEIPAGWPSEDDDPMRKPYEPYPIEPWIAPEKDEEGYPYRKNKERDRYYNIPIKPERDIPPQPVYVPSDENDDESA
jgi:hypothetical protein